VDEQEAQFEVGHVPEAVGLPLEHLDLVVEPLQGPSGDRVTECVSPRAIGARQDSDWRRTLTRRVNMSWPLPLQ
jgi:hypothetical protein